MALERNGFLVAACFTNTGYLGYLLKDRTHRLILRVQIPPCRKPTWSLGDRSEIASTAVMCWCLHSNPPPILKNTKLPLSNSTMCVQLNYTENMSCWLPQYAFEKPVTQFHQIDQHVDHSTPEFDGRQTIARPSWCLSTAFQSWYTRTSTVGESLSSCIQHRSPTQPPSVYELASYPNHMTLEKLWP